MKAKEQPSAKMLVCSHCPKEFRYNSERTRHELSHYPHFECDICNKKFSFVSALRRHQKQHERTGSVKCEQCKRKFRDEVLLKRHIRYAHKGTFVCTKCNSIFSSDLALRTHMKIHKPASERGFKCNYEGCTKSFNFSHHLKHHELTHTNAKQHYCSFCGKGFIQSHHLKTHLKTHDPTELLLCESPGCKKKFTTNYARRRHMASHKNKADSGISSDSNSCDASISTKDAEETILCAICGETISLNEYQIHSEICIKEENIDATSIDVNDDVTAEEWPNSPFKPNYNSSKVEQSSTLKSIIDGDDNMLLGCCIDNIENCMCVSITDPDTENYDFKNIVKNMIANNNNNVSDSNNPNLNCQHESTSRLVNGSTIVKVNTLSDYNQNNEKDICEGCDCANICNAKVALYDIPPKAVKLTPKTVKRDSNAPNIEYRTDGVIKIKDTFDDDIELDIEKDDSKGKRFIPFSTCKDVIGNCLVSGGDGCLCARMMADEDRAVLAQEIDDITPQPKTELL